MALYSVVRPAGAKTLLHGIDSVVVSAEDADDAKAIAAALHTGDSPWSDATTTALTEVAANATDALLGWRFRIVIQTTVPKVFELTATGAAQDTLDEVGTALATLINLDEDIANAAYNTTTQILTVAGSADALGDKEVICEVFPPIVQNAQGEQTNQDMPIPGFVVAIVDGGSSSDALTIEFPADTFIVPAVLVTARRA